MVIGTTGLTEQDHLAIARAAKLIPIIQASNTSFGVAILKRLVAAMARLLGEEYDIEIVEDHHRFKKDAPSGTALSLANAILQSTGRDASYLVFGRHGEDTVRRAGEIGIHSMRGGDKICDHTVHFAAIGEHFQFMHGATTRDTFARGALRAASWLVHQPPGQYSMDDLLPLTELSFHHLQESELTAPPSINKGRPRRTGGLRSGVHANSHI
jgi:4-hydroxy-tetrahydrodipicolinate reductase